MIVVHWWNNDWQWKIEAPREKLAAVSFYPPQIAHVLFWN
jgi:hypothetical protein